MAVLIKTCCLLFAVAAAQDLGSCEGNSGDCGVKNEADTSVLLQHRVGVEALEAVIDGHDVPDHIKSILASGIKDLPLLQEKDSTFDFRHRHPSMHHQGSVVMHESTIRGVEKILGEAAEKTGDKAAEEALEDLEEDDKNGEGASDDVENKDYDAIKEAIEEVSVGTSPEDQLKEGNPVITSQMLDEINGLPDTPEIAPKGSGSDVVEGDMMAESEKDALLLLEASAMGKRFVSNLWEDNMNIAYCFASNVAPTSKQAFEDAIEHWKEHVPCLGFKEVGVKSDSGQKCETEPGIFVFSSGGGCYANVGQPWGSGGSYQSTVCHLQPDGCDTLGVAAHELGHNIGMLHEQSRADADKYVTVLWDNIQPAYKSQYTTSGEADKTIDYDSMSLMHYSDTAFALPGKKTMVFKGESDKPMGNRQGLTYPDALQAAKMYGCVDTLKNFKLCTSKPDGCTKEACSCHQGSGLIKFTKDGCNQCLSQCPSSPQGTSGACGCPAGCTKNCFDYGGTTYCGCKDCTPQPQPQPSPAPPSDDGGQPASDPTPAPTPQPTQTQKPTTTAAPSDDGTCEDRWSFCSQYKQHCRPCFKLNGVPIEEACPASCGKCGDDGNGGDDDDGDNGELGDDDNGELGDDDNGELSPSPSPSGETCEDMPGFSWTCQIYDWLCPRGAAYKIGPDRTPFLEACKSTCEQC